MPASNATLRHAPLNRTLVISPREFASRGLGATVFIVYFVAVLDVIERVGRMLKRVVEFIQLAGSVGVVIGIRLQFVDHRGRVIDIGGDFINFSGRHDRLLGSPGFRVRVPLDVIVTPGTTSSMARAGKFLWLRSLG